MFCFVCTSQLSFCLQRIEELFLGVEWVQKQNYRLGDKMPLGRGKSVIMEMADLGCEGYIHLHRGKNSALAKIPWGR